MSFDHQHCKKCRFRHLVYNYVHDISDDVNSNHKEFFKAVEETFHIMDDNEYFDKSNRSLGPFTVVSNIYMSEINNDVVAALMKSNQRLANKLRRVNAKLKKVSAVQKDHKVADVLQELKNLKVTEKIQKRAIKDLKQHVQLQKKKLKQKHHGSECNICLDRSVDSVLVPCGHAVCYACAGCISTCPFCRKDVKESVKLFFT